MEQKDAKVKMTVEVPKSLWKRSKLQAVEEERDLRDVVIDALERYLSAVTRRKGQKNEG